MDYELDVRTVFKIFTEAIMKERGDLQFYHWFGVSGRHVEGLPSWVPDYTASNPTGMLPRVYYHSHPVTSTSESLGKVLPGMHIDRSRLVIKGSHLDTILAVGNVLCADANSHPGSDSFRDTMHNWEGTAAQILQHKRYSTPITDAFMKVLTAGQSASILWYREIGSGLLADLDPDYFIDFDVLRAWHAGAGRNESDSGDKIALTHFKRQLNECCYGRRLFVTERGSIGLAPPEAQEGDLIVFFSGALYPFVLHLLGEETFAMRGDCYLYEPRADDDSGNEDFNQYEFYENDIYRDVKEWIII